MVNFPSSIADDHLLKSYKKKAEALTYQLQKVAHGGSHKYFWFLRYHQQILWELEVFKKEATNFNELRLAPADQERLKLAFYMIYIIITYQKLALIKS